MKPSPRANVQFELSNAGVNTVSLPGPGDPAFRESLRLLSGVAWALEMLDLTAKQCNQSPASSVNVDRLVDNSRGSKNNAAPECNLERGITEERADDDRNLT
jgi:hypothetical protein